MSSIICNHNPATAFFSTTSKVITQSASDFCNIFRIDRAFINVVREPSTKRASFLFASTLSWVFLIGSAQVLGAAFAVYFLAFNFFAFIAFDLFQNSQSKNFSRLDRPYFPKSTMLKNILLGILLFIPIKNLVHLGRNSVNYAMDYLNIPSQFYQSVAVLIAQPGGLGLLMILFACILAPITEEYFFRGWANDLFTLNAYDKTCPDNPSLKTKISSWCHAFFKNPSTFLSLKGAPTITDVRKDPAFKALDKIRVIIKTSIIFALVHLDPFQGWSNILVFTATLILGTCLGLLAEYTGDLWAPTTVHLINNVLSTIVLKTGA